MKNRLIVSLLALGVSLLGVVASTPSQAQASSSQCVWPNVCISDSTAWTSAGIYQWNAVSIAETAGNCINMTGSQNNMASAIRNQSDVTVRFFDNTGCKVDSSHPGYYTIHAPDVSVYDISGISSMNDKISSIYAWNTAG